jgi:hypothetical protein
VIYYIYTVAVRPIVTYAATVWWPKVKLKTSQAELSKLQRMACLGITAAMRTTATEVLLGLPPLPLYMETEGKAGNYRLHCNDQWKLKSEGSGHAYMTQDMKKEPILQMGSHKMIPRHVSDKPFI